MTRRGWNIFLAIGTALWFGAVGALAQSPPVYSLEECLNLAVRQNPEARAAQQLLEAAAGGVIEAKAGFLPNVQLNGAYQIREQGFNNDPNRRPDEWNLSLRVTQNLYSGGGVRARVALSKLNEDSRLQDYRATLDRIMAETRTQFYDVLLAESNVAVRLQAVSFYEGEVSRQQNQLDIGTGNRRDLLRAQVSLANEAPFLIAARTQVKNAYLRLCETLALPYDMKADSVPFRIRGTLDFLPGSLNLPQLLQAAQTRRPELKARQNDIESAKQQVIVERAPVLPRVDAFVAYEALNETSISAVEDINNGYVVGLNGTWQIFDGRAAEGRIKTARARQGIAQTNRDGLLLTIQSEVLRAFYSIEQARTTLASQASVVVLAQEALVLSESGFAAGRGTQLDILNSRLDLTRARTTELDARRDYLVSLAQLQRAVSSDYQLLDYAVNPARPQALSPSAPPTLQPVHEPATSPFLRPIHGDFRLRLNPRTS